jgi:hypothetical protein
LSKVCLVPSEERQDPIVRQSLRQEHEILVLPEQRLTTASGDQAFELPLGARRVGAKPAEISIRPGLEEEHVHLMVRHADALALQEMRDGLAARSAERGEIVQTIDPDGEIGS